MPVHEIRSISQVGTSEPFELQVSRGQIPGHSWLHKFGAVPAMSINNTGTIWDINDTSYPWSSFSSASVLSVDRASASDAGKAITIIGLDANYIEISENVTLTNATGNQTTKSFIRVYRAYMYNGSSTNVGNINIKTADNVTVARITAAKGQTLMAIYTVPAGYTGFLHQGTMSVQDGADATGNMYVRYGGESAFRIGHSFEVTGQYYYPFHNPVPIPEKSDIDVRATVRSNNARITAAFDMTLIKNDSRL